MNTADRYGAKALGHTFQREFIKKLYGFDIETYGVENNFLCASVVNERGEDWFFTDKRGLIDFFKTKRFQNSYIVASNLGFDFNGTFFDEPESACFRVCYRGSSLISAVAFIYDGQFNKEYKPGRYKISFIDTMNYAPMSVEKIGKIINFVKFKKPEFLGKVPINEDQWKELREYNKRDAEVSLKFYRFLAESFTKLGANPKTTIASTTMSLFTNKYMGSTKYWTRKPEILKEQFLSYAGGRVEAIKRGTFKNVNYYDINSMYPSVMQDNEFPDPNTCRRVTGNTRFYIKNFEGVSDVDIEAPDDLNIPFLHCKTEDKLLFPAGKFSGSYTHAELRHALKLGYSIKKVRYSQFFRKSCSPFEKFVNDLYPLKKQYKADKNPMELVVKLLLNSLYGKFGQKFEDRGNIVHKGMLDMDMVQKTEGNIIRVEGTDYYSIKEDVEPSAFCIPIWSSYISAYARIKLYNYISKYDPIYYDTDSIITSHEIPTGQELGQMKFEDRINKCIIVKPKFYFYEGADGVLKSRIKGLPVKFNSFDDVERFLDSPSVNMKKIMKFKEALKRHKKPNIVFDYLKEVSLEDTKRKWFDSFSYDGHQESVPRIV